jgi:ubiquinol-cytochrome c reductase cytochrome c1 subunit
VEIKKLLTLFALVCACAVRPLAFGQEEEPRLTAAPIDPRDLTSLQSGARTFVNYCLNCHSASLMRYSKLEELKLTEQEIKDNLLFTGDKIGDVMNVAITRKDAKEWFGAPPPDLSVIARSRSADWLYTYLRSFYRDPKTATGWNNLVFPNVAMPHVLWQLQGQQALKQEPAKAAEGKEKEAAKEERGPAQAVRLEIVAPGRLSPVEYDALVRDLVNYMVWMSEPEALVRKRTGVVVLFFLGILLVLAYALYKEFWKDVH